MSNNIVYFIINVERMIYLLLLLIAIISHWQWTLNLSLLTSGDWIYQDPEMLKEFLSIPQIWSTIGLGVINLGISFTPFNFIYSLLSHAGIGFGLGERLLFMWPILIALPVGSYLLIKYTIPNRLAAFIGSLVYSYNTYFMIIKTGHLTLLSAFAFFPFVLLFYQKALAERSLRHALIASLFGFVVSFYEFRAFYILCFILFFYFLYYLFVVNKLKNGKEFFSISVLAGLPILIILLLNSYWLIPLANTGTLVSNTVFNRGLFGNEFLNILQAFTLHHPFWTGSEALVFEVYKIPFYFWLIPLGAFAGLYCKRKNKKVLFFGLITLLGLFLTKQVGQPFQEVYPLLFQYFPGFNAFREASKFYVLIALGYSVLVAALIDWLWSYRAKQKIIVYGIIFLIASLFIYNLKPVITSEIATLFVPRQIPTDYVTFRENLKQESDFFRTLWLPTFSRWSFYNNNHPAIASVNTVNGEWSSFVDNSKNDKIPEGSLTVKTLTLPFSNRLLDVSSIKYVVVPVQDTANDDNFFVFYYQPRDYYISELNKLSYLKKIDFGTKELAVFENKEYHPRIYTTLEKETLNKEIPIKRVEYKAVSPTEYKVKLEAVARPFYLNFSENYHPDWRVKIGTVNWFETLITQSAFLPETVHSKSEAMLNSFYLDPERMCGVSSKCTKNANGSYMLELTIFFRPQALVYVGIVVSFITLLTVIGIIMFTYKRK